MPVFVQHWHLILLVSGITVIEAANTNQTHLDWKGLWEVCGPNLSLKAVTVLNSDWIVQGFSHCIFKTSKDGDCTASLGNLLPAGLFSQWSGGLLLAPPQSYFFFRFKQARLTQLLLTGKVLQPPDHFGGHQLDFIPFANVFLVLQGPKLDAV